MSDPATAPTVSTCECGLNHPEIFVNKKVWESYDPDTFEKFKQAIFDHYRATGYPQYRLTDEKKRKELQKLAAFDHASLVKDDTITQSMHALGLAWSYHPHHIGVVCNNLRTVEATWNDDTLLKKVIDKRIKYGAYVSDSGIRKSVRSFTGTQAVSNFRPTAAAAIYHKFLPETGGVTWDMSMGWGGRLLGAVACDRVTTYIGCDPATQTFAGLTDMEADIKRLLPERNLKTSLHMVGSETADMKAVLPESGVDLCFTSPPYFDCEKYTNEDTQSYIKFPNAGAWLIDFMGQTLDNCYYALKPGGILAINLADVDSYGGMTDQFLHFTIYKGWDHIGEMKLALSRMMGTRQKQTGTHKYEPIFIFRKPV
jgi:hypothetical protein